MLDSMYQEGTDQVLNDRVARPLQAPTVRPSFGANLWNTTKAPFAGVGAGANESAGMFSDILGAYGAVQAGIGLQADPSLLFDSEAQAKRKQEGQQSRDAIQSGEAFSTDIGTGFRAKARSFMPDPATSNVAADVLFSFGRFATKAIGYSVAGGPVAGPVLTAVDEGMTEADKLKAQGVDFATRTKVGAVAGVAAGAAVALPVAGKTLAETAALVAVGGPGAFVGQQAASKAILENAGYDKIAEQYDPFDPVGLAVATLVPAAFGAHAMRAGKAKAKPVIDPEAVDAARVDQVQQQIVESNPYHPADVAGANDHVAAVERAHDQMAAGEPVNVTDLVRSELFIPPVARPEFKEWFGDSKVVDANGSPLVVYHGTAKAGFDSFQSDVGMGGKYGNVGIYFTKDASYADGYTGLDGAIYPVYLNIRNPFVIDIEQPAGGLQKIKDALLGQKRSKPDSQDSLLSMNVSEGMRDELRAKGFDGIINNLQNEIVVFDPGQIKSAIGNSGKFDRFSASITDQINALKVVIPDFVTNPAKTSMDKANRMMSDLMADPDIPAPIKTRLQEASLNSLMKPENKAYVAAVSTARKEGNLGTANIDRIHQQMVNPTAQKPFDAAYIADDFNINPDARAWKIGTVDAVREAMDLVGQAQFEKLAAPGSGRQAGDQYFDPAARIEKVARKIVDFYDKQPQKAVTGTAATKSAEPATPVPAAAAKVSTGAPNQAAAAPKAQADGKAAPSPFEAQTAELARTSPDMMVQLEGMEKPVRLADALEAVKKEAANDVQDANLLQVAADCFLRSA